MTQTTDPIAGDPRFPWEPPLAGTEVEHLLGMLNRLRWTFRWKASGLDAEGLNKRLGPSELTLGGLLKHLASVEALKFTWEAFRTDPGEPWRSADWSSGDDWVFASAADDSPDQLYALYDESVTNARRVIDKAIADGGIDQLTEMGDDQGNHGFGAVQLECSRAFVERRTGGHDIVDEEDDLAGDIGSTLERMADVLSAFFPREIGLRRRVSYPLAKRSG